MAVCPKFGFEITGSLRKSYCKNCVDKCEASQPAYNPLGKVDAFELARLLAEKRKNEKSVQTPGGR